MKKLESMSLCVGFNDGSIGVFQLKSPVPNGWLSVFDMLLDQVATDYGVVGAVEALLRKVES